MLAISNQIQRAMALLTVAGLLTIAPSAGQSPAPVAQLAAVPVTSGPAPVLLASSSRKPALGDIPTSSQQQQQVQQRQQLQPSAVVDTEQRIQWPMVDVDRQRNKSKVDVHVPIFFDMVNHKDDDSGKSKLDLSVLQGLVTVNRDKERDQNGQLTGPMKVTVFGIPVYTSKGLAPPPPPQPAALSPSSVPLVAAAQRDLDNTLAQVNQTLTRKAEDIVAQVTENTRRTNDKMLKSLSDIFERFSSVMRATSNRVSSTASSIFSQQQQQQQQQQQKQQEQDKLNKMVLEKKGVNQVTDDLTRANSNKSPGERVSYDVRA